ncbi:MAG: toll/interleukin-1 receptor domain-containing protein [Beggiatoa sp.]|nr:toll/interleukin-1 receptor domain-containing protein [Beggiatoa sp.]
MTAIFISHSSADNAAAAEMKAWLEAQGHTSLFLDFDPEAGIKGGSGWEQTLYRQLRQCQAVIALLTPSWLASKWCFAELVQVQERGKAIFPVKVESPARRAESSPIFSTSTSRPSPRRAIAGSGSVSWNGDSIRRMCSIGIPNGPRIRASWPFRNRTRRSSSGVARRSSRRSKPWTRCAARGARRRVSRSSSAPRAAASRRWRGPAPSPGSKKNPPNGCRCRRSIPRSNRSTSWPWRWPRLSSPTGGRATGA